MHSDASSEINSAVEMGCPSSVLKREQSKLSIPEDSQHQRVLHRKPFKLRFGRQHDLGRSTVSSTKPLGLFPIITPKFYTWEACHVESNKTMMEEVHRIKDKIDLMFNQGPKQKLQLPKLESHKYGWYHNVKFSGDLQNENPFYFGIHSSPMVKYRISIIADDKMTKQPIKK